MPFPAVPKILFIRNSTWIKTEVWKNFTTVYSEIRILPSLMYRKSRPGFMDTLPADTRQHQAVFNQIGSGNSDHAVCGE